MSAEWIKEWNYADTGYHSAVNVRFSDGVIALFELKMENTVNSGSTLPVKFALKDANGDYVITARAKQYVAPVDIVKTCDVDIQ